MGVGVGLGDLFAFLRVMVVQRLRISSVCGLGGTLGVETLLKMFGSEMAGIILPPVALCGSSMFLDAGGGVRLWRIR